jgi:hypothetical protein
MWYDYDTSPEKRRVSPKLAGATPDTSRGPFFFVLVVSGALQVVAKSFSSALLFIARPDYFLAYMVGDHAIYQVYLAMCGDHRKCIPGFGVPVSVVFRALEKVVADFTSSWLVRNPLTMHNSYFLFNQLTGHASVFVSVRVYVSSGFTDLPERTLWISAGSLFTAWALTYVARAHQRSNATTLTVFLARRYIILACMVKPEYRYLFYTAETGVEYTRTEFISAETDQRKMLIFARHGVKWAYYKDEVREFTLANWARWKEEQPSWFTEEVIQRVPDSFIPAAEVAALNAAARGGQRRRSSVGLADSVRASVRESARRGSVAE